jgi:hypothetical protein
MSAPKGSGLTQRCVPDANMERSESVALSRVLLRLWRGLLPTDQRWADSMSREC